MENDDTIPLRALGVLSAFAIFSCPLVLFGFQGISAGCFLWRNIMPCLFVCLWSAQALLKAVQFPHISRPALLESYGPSLNDGSRAQLQIEGIRRVRRPPYFFDIEVIYA